MMRVIGAHERAKQARRAVNRLRSECEPDARRPAYDLAAALGEIAETTAILRQTVMLIDDALPAEHPAREEFARLLPFYAEYHTVMR